MLNISVRRASPSDADAICALHQTSIRELHASDYSPLQIEAWIGGRRPQHYISAMEEGEIFIVAENPNETNQLLGFASLYYDNSGSGTGEVRRVYVDPTFKRAGIGTILLNWLEEEARRHGTNTLELNSSMSAVPFYTRNGYKTVQKEKFPLGDGLYLDCVKMVKRL